MAYEDFLIEVVRFLVQHPTEIIVVQVSHWSTGLVPLTSATASSGALAPCCQLVLVIRPRF
jgi:hypothetical protein